MFSTTFLAEIDDFILKDRTDGSNILTDDECVTVEFENTSNAFDFFLSETQTTVPTSTDSRFTTAVAETVFCMTTAIGKRRVYAWYRDTSTNEVSPEFVFANINLQYLPSRYVMRLEKADSNFLQTFAGTFIAANGLGLRGFGPHSAADVTPENRVMSVWVGHFTTDPVASIRLFGRVDKHPGIVNTVPVSADMSDLIDGIADLDITADFLTNGWIVSYLGSSVGSQNPNNLYYQRFDRDMNSRDGTDVLVEPSFETANPRIGSDELGRFIITDIITANAGIDFRRFNNDGTTDIATTAVATSTIVQHHDLWVHRQSGKFVVVYYTPGGLGNDVVAKRFRADGTPELTNHEIIVDDGTLIFPESVDGAQNTPISVHGRYGNDGFIVAWRRTGTGKKFYFREYDGNGDPLYPAQEVENFNATRNMLRVRYIAPPDREVDNYFIAIMGGSFVTFNNKRIIL